MSYELKDEDYLKLWMYFQDRADNVKEAMFKTLTWTIGFAAALLGFIFASLINFDTTKATVKLLSLVTISAGAGIVICLYSWFMLSESGKHIQDNWNRADRCAIHIRDLGIVIHGEVKDRGKEPMKIWNRLRIIVILFAFAFAAVFAWKIAAA